MTETKTTNQFDWPTIFTGIALLISTICLAFIVLGLRPIAQWANYQTICVKQESQKAPISWAVRKCNGRSKVYEVKGS